MTTVAIVGAGAWGTALTTVAARAGHDAVLWAREPEAAQAINHRHENPDFLPGVSLPESVRAGVDPSIAAGAAIALLVAPAQHMRSVAALFAPVLGAGVPAVICAKGVEQHSSKLMSEVVAEALPGHPIAVLSGPTFAREVADGLPTAITLACRDEAVGAAVRDALGSASFRPYLSDDVIGAQIGGAVKNVLAIACGIAEGRGLGENARAALITRGLVEIMRLAVALGGRAETAMGLSGLGDLTLTCTSTASRNYSVGVALGGGRTLEDIQRGRKSVAEGVFSASSTAALAEKLGIEMPITQAVDGILNHATPLDDAIGTLLSRPFRAEVIPSRPDPATRRS